MKTNQNEVAEIRSFGGPIELRAASEGLPEIRGYAAKFNVLSEFMHGWRERILPGAFDDRLGDDVRALINHSGVPLARTRSGTLHLSVDAVGLKYAFTPADTPEARSLIESIRRGDIDQSSFAFRSTSDKWDFVEDETDGLVRNLRGFTRLSDVSIVTFPAYPDTEAEVKRSFEDFQARKKAPEDAARADVLKRMISAIS